MAGLGEVAAELASVVHTMSDARLAMVDALRGTQRAHYVFEHTTRGSHRRLVREALTAWSNAAKNIDWAAADIAAGNSAVLDYLRDIGVGSGSSMTVGENAPTPTGTQLVADAMDSGSRWHRARQQVERNIGDVGEVTGKAVRVISELTGPRPTGTATVSRAPGFTEKRDSVTPIDNITMGVVAGAVVAAKGVEITTEKARKMVRERRARRKRQTDE